MQAFYPLKIQAIRSKGQQARLYVYFPLPLAAAIGLQAADVTNSIVDYQYADADSGMTHIYLKQTYNGLTVSNADMSINVMGDGRILSVGGRGKA